MTLTTHAVVGAALASVVPTHPVLAFGIGFCSHFLVDAIPHRDYHLSSLTTDTKNPMNIDMKLGKSFSYDLCKIGADFLLGFVLVFLFFGIGKSFSYDLTLFFGIAGALLPDALYFVYFKFKHEPFTSFEKFHIWLNLSERKMKNKPLLGAFSQTFFILFIILLQKIFVR